MVTDCSASRKVDIGFGWDEDEGITEKETFGFMDGLIRSRKKGCRIVQITVRARKIRPELIAILPRPITTQAATCRG